MEWLVFIGFWGVIIIFVAIQGQINAKKGINSEEKQQVSRIVGRIVPAGEAYTAAYAVYERTKYKTKYYNYYAIGFNMEHIYVAPLSIDDGEISYNEHYILEKSQLGHIEITDLFKASTDVKFFDKTQKQIFVLQVWKSNTKDDKLHPVNIQQPDEFQAFKDTMRQWEKDLTV